MVNDEMEFEPDGDEKGEDLPPQRFDVIVRILKVCLPTLETLHGLADFTCKSHHLEAFGQCFLASPPMALKEVDLFCGDDLAYLERILYSRIE